MSGIFFVFDYRLKLVLKWDYNLTSSQRGTINLDMKIISIKTLKDFWVRYPETEQPLRAWVDEAVKAAWKTPADIKGMYRNASILKNKRVVFNIKGNSYRLIVAIAYQRGWIFVKFVGTHEQYDEIDAETVELLS